MLLIHLTVILFVFKPVLGQTKPNVVIVMTDDQGYGEMSVHGNPILKTPHIDHLASESTQFNDFHVSPMCAPTRGQLLTGLDAAKNGCVNVSSGRGLLRKELPTMADIFKENGYATGVFGKWHLGDNYPYRPQDRGFDESIWFPSSHIGSVPDYWGNDYFDDTYIHNGKREKFEGYCTDIFFNQAMEHITKARSENTPFLVYIPTNTPHWPFFAKEEDINAIEKAYQEASIDEKNLKNKDGLIKYLAMIRNIDSNIGSLRKFLSVNNLDKNTIFIFLTDNGSIFSTQYYDAGMRGMKTQLWDGGHRVPLFLHFPNGKFETNLVNGLTQVQDILPTLIDLCDLKINRFLRFDGRSLAPQLKKNIPLSDDRMIVINYSRMPSGFEYPSPYGQSIVRKDKSVVLWKQWRLIENRELYNRVSDPMQTTDVVDQHPEVVIKMRNYLDNWWDNVKDIANDPQRIIIGSDEENPIMLTACDWLDVFVDQQWQVKRGTEKNGYWLLEVDQAGTYEFEMRRWPKELDRPLSDPEPGQKETKLGTARLFIDRVLHQKEYMPYSYEGARIKLSAEDKSATFRVELEKGPIALHTWFDRPEWQETAFGAYYVYVKRL
jgi:arylsulfatase A-like enzyme